MAKKKRNRRKRRTIMEKNVNGKGFLDEDISKATFSCSEELGALFERISQENFFDGGPEDIEQASYMFYLRFSLNKAMKENEFKPHEISDLLDKYIYIQYEDDKVNCSKVFVNLDLALYEISGLRRKNKDQYICTINLYLQKKPASGLIKLPRIYTFEILNKKTGKAIRIVPLGIDQNEYNKMPQSEEIDTVTDKSITPEGLKVMDIYYRIKDIMTTTAKMGINLNWDITNS